MIRRIFEIFTSEYRKETLYRESETANLEKFKLKTNSESVDIKINRLKDIGFCSEFKINYEY